MLYSKTGDRNIAGNAWLIQLCRTQASCCPVSPQQGDKADLKSYPMPCNIVLCNKSWGNVQSLQCRSSSEWLGLPVGVGEQTLSAGFFVSYETHTLRLLLSFSWLTSVSFFDSSNPLPHSCLRESKHLCEQFVASPLESCSPVILLCFLVFFLHLTCSQILAVIFSGYLSES